MAMTCPGMAHLFRGGVEPALRHHETLQCFPTLPAEVQPQLRAAPQHVLRRCCPLVPHQMACLGSAELLAKPGTDFLGGLVAAEDAVDPRAIRADEPPCMRLGQERPPRAR